MNPSASRSGCGAITAQTPLLRINRDLVEFYGDPVDEIFLSPDDQNLTQLHALVIGPKGTPYEGGFFYFFLEYPANYPIVPPKVRLMTTGNGSVRFNPNLYACGKVCLSIIGTWAGPSWSAALSTKTLLLSIQSLMCENPYFNEPGYESSKNSPQGQKASEIYNRSVSYNTLKVAVLDMVEDVNGDTQNMPDVFKAMIKEMFVKKIEFYESRIMGQMVTEDTASSSRPKAPKSGPHGELYMAYYGEAHYGKEVRLDYTGLKQRLDRLKETLKIDVDGKSPGSISYDTIASKYAGNLQPITCQQRVPEDVYYPPMDADSDSDGEGQDQQEEEGLEEEEVAVVEAGHEEEDEVLVMEERE